MPSWKYVTIKFITRILLVLLMTLLPVLLLSGESLPCRSVAAGHRLGDSDKVRPLHWQLCVFVHVVCQASARLDRQTDVFLGL